MAESDDSPPGDLARDEIVKRQKRMRTLMMMHDSCGVGEITRSGFKSCGAQCGLSLSSEFVQSVVHMFGAQNGKIKYLEFMNTAWGPNVIGNNVGANQHLEGPEQLSALEYRAWCGEKVGSTSKHDEEPISFWDQDDPWILARRTRLQCSRLRDKVPMSASPISCPKSQRSKVDKTATERLGKAPLFKAVATLAKLTVARAGNQTSRLHSPVTGAKLSDNTSPSRPQTARSSRGDRSSRGKVSSSRGSRVAQARVRKYRAVQQSQPKTEPLVPSEPTVQRPLVTNPRPWRQQLAGVDIAALSLGKPATTNKPSKLNSQQALEAKMKQVLGRDLNQTVLKQYARVCEQQPLSARNRSSDTIVDESDGAPACYVPLHTRHTSRARLALEAHEYGKASSEFISARTKGGGADKIDPRLIQLLRPIFQEVDEDESGEIDEFEMKTLVQLFYGMARREILETDIEAIVSLEMSCYDVLRQSRVLGFEEFCHWANQGTVGHMVPDGKAAGLLSMIQKNAVTSEQWGPLLLAAQAGQRSQEETELLSGVLEKADCLRGRCKQEMEALAGEVQLVRAHEGELLLSEDDRHGPALYLVLSGVVVLSERSFLASVRAVTQFAWAGDLFGHVEDFDPCDQRFQAVVGPDSQHCTLLRLQGSDYDRITRTSTQAASVSWWNQVQSMAWIRSESRVRVWQLLSLCSHRRLCAGEPVSEQGQPLAGFLIILTGTLSASRGKQNVELVGTLRPGEFFGEQLLLSKERPVMAQVRLVASGDETQIVWLDQAVAPQIQDTSVLYRELVNYGRNFQINTGEAMEKRLENRRWNKYRASLVAAIRAGAEP